MFRVFRLSGLLDLSGFPTHRTLAVHHPPVKHTSISPWWHLWHMLILFPFNQLRIPQHAQSARTCSRSIPCATGCSDMGLLLRQDRQADAAALACACRSNRLLAQSWELR